MRDSPEGQELLASLDERLRTVITETVWHRKMIKTVNEEIFALLPSTPSVPSSPGPSSMHKLMTSTSTSTSIPDILLNRRAHHVSSTQIPLVQPTNKTKGQRKNKRRRDKLKEAKLASASTAPKPSWLQNSCPNCQHKPEEERCIRIIYVKENHQAAKYVDFAMTCAPEGDRLKPKKKHSVCFDPL
jgi:hypothetical protein